jgi:hypothetical protein
MAVVEHRTDFSEFWDEKRTLRWRDYLGPDPEVSALIEEAVGHAVGLRDQLYEHPDGDPMIARNRALNLVEVLNALTGKYGQSQESA